MVLAIRTDKPEAELFLYKDDKELGREIWQAHRQLSSTLLKKIEQLLDRYGMTQQDLSGLVVFQGPGSFTGLRIGISVANALAYSLQVPIVGVRGDNWQPKGLQGLGMQTNLRVITPEYGSQPHITQPKK